MISATTLATPLYSVPVLDRAIVHCFMRDFFHMDHMFHMLSLISLTMSAPRSKELDPDQAFNQTLCSRWIVGIWVEQIVQHQLDMRMVFWVYKDLSNST